MGANNRDVYLKSAGLLSVAALATVLLARLLAPMIQDPALRCAAAFSLLQLAAVTCLAAYIFARRAHTQFRLSIQEQIRPALEQRIMGFALTGEAWSTPVPKRGAVRQVLEECIAHALTGLRDSSKERVAQFARDHGFVTQWVKACSSSTPNRRKQAISRLAQIPQVESSRIAMLSALHDQQPTIRAEAARALLTTGEPHNVEQVFRSALRESPLVRALLTSDLKRHARFLMANAILPVLRESTAPDTQNCLELLNVWRLAMPALESTSLLEQHHGPHVLPVIFALLPYMTVGDSIEDDLLAALASEVLEVQCAAAEAAGHLKLERLIPALVPLLDRPVSLALASAFALARMGPPGVRSLERIVSGTGANAASVAMEALESLTVGTL